MEVEIPTLSFGNTVNVDDAVRVDAHAAEEGTDGQPERLLSGGRAWLAWTHSPT
jgi:hypothetical protein